jgi:hypothetical protein
MPFLGTIMKEQLLVHGAVGDRMRENGEERKERWTNKEGE